METQLEQLVNHNLKLHLNGVKYDRTEKLLHKDRSLKPLPTESVPIQNKHKTVAIMENIVKINVNLNSTFQARIKSVC